MEEGNLRGKICRIENSTYSKYMAALLTDLFYYTPTTQYTDAMFQQMWEQDKNRFIQTIFYLRQHRSSKWWDASGIIPTMKQSLRRINGRGERKIFYQAIIWMSSHQLPALLTLLPYIPDYGYWKDLLVLLGTPAEDAVITIFANQLQLDFQSFHQPVPGLISMAAKWTPNEGSSFDRKHDVFGKITHRMGLSRKILRKYYLVPLRRYLSVTEQIVNEKRWTAINYDRVPHRSRQLHQKAFQTNDAERYIEHLNRSHVDYVQRFPLPPLVYSILRTSPEITVENPESPIENPESPISTTELKPSDTMYAIDISGAMTGFPITLAACLCIENGSSSWLPFMFDSETDGETVIPCVGNTCVAQINNIVATQANLQSGMNLKTCIKLISAHHKGHLIIISNTLLDISEIPPRPPNLHLTYWSLHFHPVTINDHPQCTIIEGYDMNIYLELREGNILTRDGYTTMMMMTPRANILPLL